MRRRRTAEQAREEILAAAEQQLAQGGPAALRLQELAAQVGVSHPAILHHFGSKEGLVKAVVARAVETLQDDLKSALSGGGPVAIDLLERVHETLATKGHARLLGWLLLSGYEPFDSAEIRAKWRDIIDQTHAARVAGGSQASREDTAFTVVLSAMTLFAQALVGRSTFHAAGLPANARADARFREWLAGVLLEHLAEG
jgi:AcrR family transcriptional regulator